MRLLRGDPFAWLRWCARIGVNASVPRHQAKHVILTNEIAIGIFFANVVSLVNPQNLTVFGPALRIDLVIDQLTLMLVLVANHARRYVLASTWLVLTQLVWVAFLSCITPESTQHSEFLLAGVLVCWFAFPSHRTALRWTSALLYFATIVGVRWVEHRFPAPDLLTEAQDRGFATSNRIGAFLVIFAVGLYASREGDRVEAELEREHARSDALLFNVLPRRIAERLKVSDGAIAERFAEATVLFADIVNFTPLAESMPAEEIVGLLDDLFTRFDALADASGLEKIKTIGDAYMLAAGVPEPRADHVEAMADVAIAMRGALDGLADPRLKKLGMRIGIHTGPVVAGVIGKRKLLYDLWGDTVNTASRMESHGELGRIQVTGAVYERLRGSFSFEESRTLHVKGKGALQTYFLGGRTTAARSLATGE